MNYKFAIEYILSNTIAFYITYPFQYNLFYIVSYFSMIIVFYMAMEEILVPILYSLVFACGYTLIYIYCIDVNKAKKQPLKVASAVLKRFTNGIIADLTSIGDITECRCGDWYYEPLFKITKESES